MKRFRDMERLYSFLWWFIQVYQRFSIMFPRIHTCILVEILFGRTEFYFGRKNCDIHHGYELKKKRRLFEDIHCISFNSHGITGYITTQKLYKYASPINVNQSHIRKCKKKLIVNVFHISFILQLEKDEI